MRVLLIALCASLVSGFAAAEGEQTFGAHCARCHAPIEIKRRMLGDWLGRTAADLFSTTKQTMPGESPGSLSDDEYLAVVAYMLDLAGVNRPGDALSTMALTRISIIAQVRDEYQVSQRRI